MNSLLRNRFGIPGIISVIALVFAMSGGAFAAKDYLGGDATASKAKKGKKGPRGKRGPRGPAGANGTNGEKGAAGSPGAKGATGETGATGDTGSPWTAGGTLPSGETETGSWGLVFSGAADMVDVSFPIPLAAALDAAHVVRIPAAGTPPAVCEEPGHPGAASPANPEADPGYLCVYHKKSLNGNGTLDAIWDSGAEPGVNEFFELVDSGAATTGAVLILSSFAGEITYGTFAVTAP